MALQLLDGAGGTFELTDNQLPDVTDGDAEVVYVLRQIEPDMHRQISKQHTTHPINRRTGAREVTVDQVALIDALVNYALVEWRGILLSGQPAPCTPENKVRLDWQRKVGIAAAAVTNRQTTEERDHSFRKLTSVV